MVLPLKVKRISLAVAILFSIPVLQAASLKDPAPRFSLLDVRGKTRSLDDFKGKILFINFWASWCAPCQVELPQLDLLASDYDKRRFALVAINIDNDPEKAKKVLSVLKIGISDMDVLFDPNSSAATAYDLEAMPSSFILDANGVIQSVHIGFHDDDPAKWRKEIDGLLAALSEK